MNTPALPRTLLCCALFCAGLTGLAPAYAASTPIPPALAVAPAAERTLEMVFVLDTTGSMGGLIDGAKTKIWWIINNAMQQQAYANAKVRVGLVAYRDRGDRYLTQVKPLSENLDEVYQELMAYRAEGGGDGPEDVRSAMRDGLEKVQWSAAGGNTRQILFLVGDAPPHDDYAQLPDTTVTASRARQRGILINAIQCGNDPEAGRAWRKIAQHGGGEYFAIAADGGVSAVVTPFDERLATLGKAVGDTYLAYGSADSRSAKQSKQAMAESRVMAAAPAAAKADRALNKAINREAYDSDDLLQQIEQGKLSLDKVAEAELPDTLQKQKPAERAATVDKLLKERKALREEIVTLSKEREQYIASQKAKSGGQDGFDKAVAAALGRQLK